jgi:hypothetical protein
MKSKFFVFMAAAIMTFTLAFVASAQKKNDPATTPKIDPANMPKIAQRPQTVTLTCSPGQGKDVSTPLYVKNPTATDLPAGTVIHWSAVKGGTATGKETTTAVLKKNSGNQVSVLGPPDNIASCKAWVVK